MMTRAERGFSKHADAKRDRICIIAFPSIPDNPHLTALIKIFTPLTSRLCVVTGNYQAGSELDVQVIVKNVKYIANARTLWEKTATQLLFQLQSFYFLLSNASSFDIVVFHIGTTLVLPMTLSRILRKKSLLYLSGSQAESVKWTYGGTPLGSLLYNIIAIIETLNMHLATKMVAYTPSIVETLHLDLYRNKILTTGARYVDTKEFAQTTAITDRKDVIGYVGRLSREKGVLNLIQAMPEIVHERPAVQLCIIGEGPLHDAARRMTQENGLIERVRFLGEIPHHRIPTCLNEMKLLVMPSYTEGLPTILLEAMACGTPVLATPVGNIPDIIDDGENGFIIPANSPSILAAAIVAALSNDKLGGISNHAAESVAAHYSFEASVARHREIIKSLE